MNSRMITRPTGPALVVANLPVPESQTQLLLHEAKTQYKIEHARSIPELLPGEILVRVEAIGLNPIDWKSAEYGFALPAFPCVNGREYVGQVVRQYSSLRSDLTIGDKILAVSTDYRDSRQSAFQQYAIVKDFNVVKIPSGFDSPHAASVGVAFVAATIGLGICLGLTFPDTKEPQALNLLDIARLQDENEVPEDAFDEVFNAISHWNRPNTGDWILIYGASTVTAQVSIQLAKLGGLKVVAVADVEKHGKRLKALGADKVIDRHDLEKATSQIRSQVPMPIRFALDTIGAETANWCQNILASRTGTQYRPSRLLAGNNNITLGPSSSLSHLVCLVAAPKEKNTNVHVHTIPIKLFHTNRDIGRAVSGFLSVLLKSRDLNLPETVYQDGGLDTVGSGLERLKNGELSGKRLVVRLK